MKSFWIELNFLKVAIKLLCFFSLPLPCHLLCLRGANFSESQHLDQDGCGARQGSRRGPAREEKEGVDLGPGQVHGQADQGQVLWWEGVQWGAEGVRMNLLRLGIGGFLDLGLNDIGSI